MANDTLFVIDIDGVVLDSTKRFEKAKTTNGSTDWGVAFDPALLSLDTIIENAGEMICDLDTRGSLVYLTSRPESLQDATYEQLKKFGLIRTTLVAALITKPESKKFVKTMKWKAEEVHTLAEKHENVVFIDDEKNNRQAVEELELPNVACFKSLEQAHMAERSQMYQKNRQAIRRDNSVSSFAVQ